MKCTAGPGTIVCLPGYGMLNNVCTACGSLATSCTGSCTSNGFFNSASNVCTACSNTAGSTLTCSSASIALSCASGYYLNTAAVCVACANSLTLSCPVTPVPI